MKKGNRGKSITYNKKGMILSRQGVDDYRNSLYNIQLSHNKNIKKNLT